MNVAGVGDVMNAGTARPRIPVGGYERAWEPSRMHTVWLCAWRADGEDKGLGSCDERNREGENVRGEERGLG